MRTAVIRIILTSVFLVAALTQLFGIGHWVNAFTALGAEPILRYVTALLQILGLVLFWWPGRRGYGAAILCGVALAAVIAHLAALGVSSVLPALILAVLSALVLRQHRGDFAR